ncbi:PTS system mannitol-specific transporter subunit IIC (plasmid) [Klebsiella aerogenes]|nr:PTS system mannitol-specific transporter subunit IIC [Klebsiella aerogenes]
MATALRKFDAWVDGKIKSGFEMLVNNFSAGIIGMILAILAFLGIGPAVEVLSKLLAAGVNFHGGARHAAAGVYLC